MQARLGEIEKKHFYLQHTIASAAWDSEEQVKANVDSDSLLPFLVAQTNLTLIKLYSPCI